MKKNHLCQFLNYFLKLLLELSRSLGQNIFQACLEIISIFEILCSHYKVTTFLSEINKSYTELEIL